MSQKPHYPEDKKPFNLPHVALLVHFGNYHGGIVLDPSYTIILITTILITYNKLLMVNSQTASMMDPHIRTNNNLSIQ